MPKKKRYRGHFCKVCGRILPNEKFSGKGHAAHICKTCAKKPEDKRLEGIALNRIQRVYRYGDLSRNNRKLLEDYSHSPNERVRSAAKEAISTFRKDPLPTEDRNLEEDFVDEKDLGL
jgi:methionyl-tRNA synthetase